MTAAWHAYDFRLKSFENRSTGNMENCILSSRNEPGQSWGNLYPATASPAIVNGSFYLRQALSLFVWQYHTGTGTCARLIITAFALLMKCERDEKYILRSQTECRYVASASLLKSFSFVVEFFLQFCIFKAMINYLRALITLAKPGLVVWNMLDEWESSVPLVVFLTWIHTTLA